MSISCPFLAGTAVDAVLSVLEARPAPSYPVIWPCECSLHWSFLILTLSVRVLAKCESLMGSRPYSYAPASLSS